MPIENKVNYKKLVAEIIKDSNLTKDQKRFYSGMIMGIEINHQLAPYVEKLNQGIQYSKILLEAKKDPTLSDLAKEYLPKILLARKINNSISPKFNNLEKKFEEYLKDFLKS